MFSARILNQDPYWDRQFIATDIMAIVPYVALFVVIPASAAFLAKCNGNDHRSGLRNNDIGVRTRGTDGPRDIRDIVRNFRHLPLQWQPRTQFDYNNEGYATLSYVIETITGKWLGDVLKETIWGPLGMSSTYLDLQQAKDAPGHLSTVYYWSDTKNKYSFPF